ncbi:MAG: hypothetical protein V4615_07370 [Bacteroidota bacterium]
MKLAHVINPVKAPLSSELSVVQPITFESIRVAKEFAAGKTAVELYTISFAEDLEIIPSFFVNLPDLNRSLLDVGSFTKAKKYPILMDVFRALYKASDAEYLIYTNMDIALMPHFYVTVADLIKDDTDVLLITRRGISAKYKKVEELHLMYSDFGEPHPGFDCFIFKRHLLEKIILENICLGVSFSEVALVHNFIAFAEKLKLVDDLHLTFHIGREVMPPLERESFGHNKNEFQKKIYPQLEPFLDIRKFPYSKLPFYKRMIKWILNPSFRTHQVLEMEGKNFRRKVKYRIDGVRFSLLDKIR